MQGRLLDKSQHPDYLSLDKLIPKKHYLRKVNEFIDFSFIKEITEHCYCLNNGRPSIAPELYFRMMLIGYIFSIKSTRQLVQHIHYNICYRWFCGLTLNDSIPHHASLSRIKKRYTVEVFEKFFQAIVEQCQHAGLLQSQSAMTDSTLIQANASLNSMKPLNKDVPKNIKPSKDGISESKWHISNKTHRSKTDPDATLAYKSGTLRSLKYKAHVCCDSKSRVISAIKITTGAVHDSQPYLDLIVQLKNKFMLREVIADRAYGSGEVISSLNDEGIQEFIPLFTTRSGKTSDKEIYGINYDEIKKTYICSANIEFKPGKINSEGYISYRTHTKDCRECSLKTICQAPQMKNREIRVMARHIHADLFQKVKIKMETEEFKEKLRERLWKIEGVMNELKNYHCLSKAKYRGLDNMQIQAYIAAVVINIKRLVNFLLFSFISHYMVNNRSTFTTGRYVIFHKQP